MIIRPAAVSNQEFGVRPLDRVALARSGENPKHAEIDRQRTLRKALPDDPSRATP
jgi:hypothetical protein